MKLTHLHEAQYKAPERWIHEDRMHDLIQALCFNGYGSVSDFWSVYHQELIPFDGSGGVGKSIDDDYSYKFLSDLAFKRKQHTRSMNATLEQWGARFRVNDMRWIGEDDDAPIEWKVVGIIPDKVSEAQYHGNTWIKWLEKKITDREDGKMEIPEKDLMDVYHYMTNKYGQGMMLRDEDTYIWEFRNPHSKRWNHEVAVDADGQLWITAN